MTEERPHLDRTRVAVQLSIPPFDEHDSASLDLGLWRPLLGLVLGCGKLAKFTLPHELSKRSLPSLVLQLLCADMTQVPLRIQMAMMKSCCTSLACLAHKKHVQQWIMNPEPHSTVYPRSLMSPLILGMTTVAVKDHSTKLSWLQLDRKSSLKCCSRYDLRSCRSSCLQYL